MVVRYSSACASFTFVVMTAAACGSFDAADIAGPAGDASPAEGGGGIGEAGIPDAAPVDGATADGGMITKQTVLAGPYTALSGIAATKSEVYFVEQGKGGVHRVSIDGGKVADLATPGGTPRSIVISADESALFWTQVAKGNVQQMPIGGGFVTSSTEDTSRRSIDSAVLPDGVVALFAQESNGSGAVESYSTDLAIPMTVVVGGFSNPVSVATRGDEVFWSEGSNSAIGHVKAGTVQSEPDLNNENSPGSVAIDANGVYWARPSDGLIRGRLGAAAPQDLATNQGHASSLAADGTSVYWMTENGFIRRLQRQPSTATVTNVGSGFVAINGPGTPPGRGDLVRALAVTGLYVVWLTGDGYVMRAPK